MAKSKTKKEIRAKFNKLEKQIIEKLKNNKLDILENDDEIVVKEKIKKYQSKLKEIEENFCEFEKLSKEVLELENNDFNKNFNTLSLNDKEQNAYEDEIVVEDGKVKTHKKKKDKNLEK